MDVVFVIAFVAAGCQPCDDFKRDLAGGELASEVRVVVVDVKEHPELARKCGVQVTPTFAAIRDERQVLRMSGYRGREPFAAWMNEVKRVAAD